MTAHTWQTDLLGSVRASLNIPAWLTPPTSVAEPLEAYHRLEAKTDQAHQHLEAMKAAIPDVELATIRAESAAIKAGKPAPKSTALDAHLAEISKAEGTARAHQHALRVAENELLGALMAARGEWLPTAGQDVEQAEQEFCQAVEALRAALEALTRARAVPRWLENLTVQRPAFRTWPLGNTAPIFDVLAQIAQGDRPDLYRVTVPPPPLPELVHVPSSASDQVVFLDAS